MRVTALMGVLALCGGCEGMVSSVDSSGSTDRFGEADAGPGATSPPGTGPDDAPPSGDPGLPCDVREALASCQGCHGATPRYGAPMPLITQADFHRPTPSNPSVPVWQTARVRIDDPVAPMPPAAAGPLPDASHAALAAWLDASAPSGTCDTAPPGSTPPGDGGDPLADLPCEPTHVLRAHAPGGTDAYEVPSDAGNLYECFAFRPTWGAETQATAWAPLIGDDRVVHHWILYKTSTAQTDGGVFECSSMPGDAQFVMGWAPGGGATVMPGELGFELPDPDEMLLLQVHYWNVAGHTDARDDTGVAICATDTPRPQAAGILWLGTLNIDIPPRATNHETTGTCPSLLTRFLPGPLNVLAASPHMHEFGRAFRTEIVRAGGGRDTVIEVDPWDFNDQRNYQMDRELVIQPGDAIETTCVYDNPTDQRVRFGERTEDEMCFNFVTVYPTSHLPDERRCFL